MIPAAAVARLADAWRHCRVDDDVGAELVAQGAAKRTTTASARTGTKAAALEPLLAALGA